MGRGWNDRVSDRTANSAGVATKRPTQSCATEYKKGFSACVKTGALMNQLARLRRESGFKAQVVADGTGNAARSRARALKHARVSGRIARIDCFSFLQKVTAIN